MTNLPKEKVEQMKRKLDKKGRCCGKKPLIYKRNRILFCDRCDRSYGIETKEQVSNWAYPDGVHPK